MQSKLVFIIFFTFSFTMEWIDYNVMGVQGNGEGFIMMYEYFNE